MHLDFSPNVMKNRIH